MWFIKQSTMADATFDVKSVCTNSESARSKNRCGSGHRFKQWHEHDNWADSIFSWPSIISRQSELLIFNIDWAGYDVLFSVVFFFGLPVLRPTVWSTMKAVTAPHCRTAIAGMFGPKPLRPGTPDRPKSICFYWGSSCRTAFSGINFDFGTSVKRTVSEYCNQNIARECYTPKNRGECKNWKKCQYHNQTNCHEV